MEGIARTPVVASDSLLAKAREWYPKYVTFLSSDKIDSVWNYSQTDIVPVHYEVNRTRLRPSNQLHEIVEVINRMKVDERVKIAYVWVGGSASPEGSEANNRRLGRQRAQRLASYIAQQTELPLQSIRQENLAEDWATLSAKLDTLDFPYRTRVKKIIAEQKDEVRRKHLIWQLDNGRTWRYLLREHFADLRNARMVIVCAAEDIRSFASPLLPIDAAVVVPDPVEFPTVELEEPRPQVLDFEPTPYRFFSIKNNLLFTAILQANLGFEVELWPRWSLDVPVWYSPYDYTPTRKIRLLATQPELRYWPRKAGEGFFAGLHTHIVGFNVALNDDGRYQDPNHALWGVGFSVGYATHLDTYKRWGLEFTLGAGYSNYIYDSYRNWVNGPRFATTPDNHYWGLTRLGINLSYKFYRPRSKGTSHNPK